MILSRRHNYIFLHCLKTAGTSATVSLARSLGPRDIQIGSFRETIKAGIRPTAATTFRLTTSRGFRHFARTLAGRRDFSEAFNSGVKVSFISSLGRHPEHCHAKSLREVYPVDWQKCFKFCVVRNPYDRAVSYYFWVTKKWDIRPSFSDFVSRFYDRKSGDNYISQFADNWPIYTIEDEIAVDKVIRFENLSEDLHGISKQIGMPWDGWMPRAKSESRKISDYRSLYRDVDIELVSEFFNKEIEAFGYSFE